MQNNFEEKRNMARKYTRNNFLKRSQDVNSDNGSFLSVRDNSSEASSLLSVRGGMSEKGYLAVSEINSNGNAELKDVCAFCFSSPIIAKLATHFCEDCGLLGHFLCETCLSCHKILTNHSHVKSLAAAKYRSEREGFHKDNREHIDDLTEKLADAKRENEKMKHEKETLEKKLLQDHQNKHNYSDETGEQNEEIIYLRKSVLEKDRRIQQLEEKVPKLNTENSETIPETQLFEIAEGRLTDRNPNITDLSDLYRPTKLAERFEEICCSEWTDAYEEMECMKQFKTDKDVVGQLYQSLLDIFEFCKTLSEDYEKKIYECVLTVPYGRPISAKIAKSNQQQLKRLKKCFAPCLLESVYEQFLIRTKVNVADKKKTGAFLKKCVEICWLMNSQDPPVVFDTSEVEEKAFDDEKFSPYMKSGKVVDYVVWPPMLLHKDGPLLCKGVAQGK